MIILSSCVKEQFPYRDEERNYNATVMQNRINDTWSFNTGLFYGIQEDGISSFDLRFGAIAGFDNLYTEGYQYKVRLKEICRIYRRIEDTPMDTHGCELSLIRLISKSKVEEEFTVFN